jgi:hypothetical protein
MSYYLAIVGTHDNPMYESYFTSTVKTSSSTIMSVPLPSVSTSFSIFGGLPSTPSLGSSTAGKSQVGYGHKNGQGGRHVMQLVAHASLDVVEDVQWSNGGMSVLLYSPLSTVKVLTENRQGTTRYLKNIDKFHEWTVSAWLTPGGSFVPSEYDSQYDC